MKKAIAVFLTCVALSTCLFAFAGCGNKPKSSGYFLYYDDETWEYVELFDLTEEGHKQKYIIMPETINGKPYWFVESKIWSPVSARFSNNDTLEKIYFEFYDSNVLWSDDTNNGTLYEEIVFEKCNALKKIILNHKNQIFTTRIVYNETMWLGGKKKAVYTNYDNIPVFVDEEGGETKCLVTYDIWETVYLANVEFMFNYDDAPNNGYYWIDDIDDGEKLEVIPPDPTRDGYVFDGWYCEEECVNRFDFDSAIIKSEPVFFTTYEVIEDNRTIKTYDIYLYPENYVTYIYAKWIEQ